LRLGVAELKYGPGVPMLVMKPCSQSTGCFIPDQNAGEMQNVCERPGFVIFGAVRYQGSFPQTHRLFVKA